MKKNITIALLLFSALLLFVGCGKKNVSTDTHPDNASLTLQKVTQFARVLEKSILSETPNPDIFNSAFDQTHLRKVLSENSIVSSALDLDYGQQIFEGNLNYGFRACAVVESGGDFRLDTCYEKAGQFHAVFRIYDTLGYLQFDDFTIGANAKGECVIKDEFSYNLSCLLSTKMISEIKYNALRNIEQPDSSSLMIQKVVELSKTGGYAEILRILKSNPTLAQEYPAYNMYYIMAIDHVSTQYMADLEWMKNTGVDERFLLVHAINHLVSIGEADEAFKTMNRLMDYTSDDPIYWVVFGKTLTNNKKYEDALSAFQNAKLALPYIWDIWFNELRCYYALGKAETFASCLDAGKQLYGMKEEELQALARKNFPQFAR